MHNSTQNNRPDSFADLYQTTIVAVVACQSNKDGPHIVLNVEFVPYRAVLLPDSALIVVRSTEQAMCAANGCAHLLHSILDM